jgi:glyoxylase-like metal-dependent hydrolase (beta-lactamase superfamily II)
MTMKVHHLNCATMRPFPASLVQLGGSWTARGTMVCHCLLIEAREGLVLVDSGIGLADCADPSRLGGVFKMVVSPRYDAEETAARQVERLGYRRSDVRHVVLTHMDLDHAGGLGDFPGATVHVYRAEHEAAMDPRGEHEKLRYRAVQWAHGPRWQLHDDDGESFFGLRAVRAIVEPEVLLVPTCGHSRGHAAVAVRTGDRWLFHCGDAYFNHDEIHAEKRRCPPGLAFFQRTVAADDDMRRHNQKQLRALARDHGGEVSAFCAHDPAELEAAQSSSSTTTRSASSASTAEAAASSPSTR